MTLEEWFSDRVLFHLVGYLIHDNYRLAEIRKSASGITKKAFRRSLRSTIFRRLLGRDIPASGTAPDISAAVRSFVDELDYDANRVKIKSLLLLFNVATILLNPRANLRFPFHHFIKSSWDIEHVRSVKSGKPDQQSRCQDWLCDFVTHLGDVGESKDLCTRARQLLDSDPFDVVAFDGLYDAVLATFQESTDTESDNGVGNLALLDSGTNRSYKNAVFPVKRSKIIALDRQGTFVPLCTKNVFLKCYSKEIGKMMFWGKTDRDAYRDNIVETLSTFFAMDIVE
jgi:hypothetical protein